MGYIRRNGRAYYIRSIRRGGKVTSEYVGTGFAAEAIALLDRDFRTLRRLMRLEIEAERQERIEGDRAERAKLRELAGRLAGADRLVAGYSRRVDRAVGSTLVALGFHRHHRGDWRKRRGEGTMRTDLARLDIRELVRLAREGERLALGELADRSPGCLYEIATKGEGDLDADIERALIEQLGPGHGALHKEGVAAHMALLRVELAPADCSPIEKLLVERAVVCWLHVQLMEYEAAGVYAGPDPDVLEWRAAREIDRRAEVIDRRLARAQSRYVQALAALARVRRLAIPPIVAQFNLAQAQQVNVAGVAREAT
jgi:hypothetical protein